MIEIVLVRHGKTAGNLEGRYIGSRTDESLCPEGIEELRAKKYPLADRIYLSPMKRCLETAGVLWPELTASGRLFVAPGLRECDFGDFENKNYKELDGNPDYQAWIDSGGTLPFPNGESMEAFKLRCQVAFAQIVQEIKEEQAEASDMSADRSEGAEKLCIAIVAHGGTIMAILEKYGFPKKQYFDYQVKNGCGYVLTPVEGTELWNCQYLP